MPNNHCCQGVHFWVRGGPITRNQVPVGCAEYVARLERELVTLTGCDDAVDRLMSRWMGTEALMERHPASNKAEPDPYVVPDGCLGDCWPTKGGNHLHGDACPNRTHNVPKKTPVCSRCRERDPRAGGRWCLECFEAVREEVLRG